MIMLIAFMALAVPVAVGAVQLAGALARQSLPYERLEAAKHSASSGVEYALWEMLNDATFDAALTPQNPTSTATITINNAITTVTVTKIFSAEDLQGQGLILTKTVTPTTTPVNTPTTFTYTINLTNEGTDAVTLEQITDRLPPNITYVLGSTSGLVTNDPIETQSSAENCGVTPSVLTWDLSPYVQVAAAQVLTLSFQATGTLPDGTYYNQASPTCWDPVAASRRRTPPRHWTRCKTGGG